MRTRIASRSAATSVSDSSTTRGGCTVWWCIGRSNEHFAVGDRVQTTAPCASRRVANRDLGRIERVDDGARISVQLESGRTVRFDLITYPHLDYGYAMTSHSSQGQTADRVLVHVDTEHIGEELINRRLAYVAVSRGRYDAQIYTDDKARARRATEPRRLTSVRAGGEPRRSGANLHAVGHSCSDGVHTLRIPCGQITERSTVGRRKNMEASAG